LWAANVEPSLLHSESHVPHEHKEYSRQRTLEVCNTIIF
jgi:hypothetical protein